jgi:hypothetical protein
VARPEVLRPVLDGLANFGVYMCNSVLDVPSPKGISPIRPNRGVAAQLGTRIVVRCKDAGWGPLPMPPIDTRKRLREIRDEERRVASLVPERNRLIREAAGRGDSQRELAKDTDLSKSRIGQIVRSRRLDE